MTAGLNVAKGERGLLRVFAADLTPEEAGLLRANDPPEDEAQKKPLNAALSVTLIDADFIELFDVSRLEGVGLVSYLRDANEIRAEDIEADEAALSALTGYVLLVFSDAFGGFETTVAPDPRFRFIGAYRDVQTDWTPVPIETASAAPYSGAPAGKKKPSDAAMSGRIASLALIVLFLLVAVMIWVAG